MPADKVMMNDMLDKTEIIPYSGGVCFKRGCPLPSPDAERGILISGDRVRAKCPEAVRRGQLPFELRQHLARFCFCA